jgi:thioester reductase-like protein
MSDRDMQRLVFALAQATTTNLGPSSTTTSRKTKLSVLFSRNTFLITGVVLISICASIYAFGGNSSHLLWLLQTMVLVVFTAIRLYLAFYISWCVVLYLLRLSSSGVYLGTNKAFAKYYYELRRARCSEEDTIIAKNSNSASTPLDKTEKTTDETMVSRRIVDMIPCLQLASTSDNLSRDNSQDGKASNIIKDSTCPDMNGNMALLTGATGFIGSLLLRDLLLHRIALSLEGGVVIICRPKRKVSAAHRIKKLLSNPMYDFLSDEEKACLVTVVEGDVTQPDVGMSNNDKERVCNKFVISHVFHCAAAVKFTQSLDDAAVSNITSSLQMQALTKTLKMKKAKYIHISTAFVHGDRVGTASDPIEESLYSLHPYNAEEIYRSMRETQSYASSAMLDLGFPNTYTFSKCVCEHLLHRDTSVDTIIIRPSIVGPAVQEPYEGWAGDKPSTIVAAACLYYTLPCVIWCYGSVSPPVVPVDVVSSFILAKAFAVDIPTDSSLETSPPSSQSSSDDDSDEFLKLSKGKVQGLVAKSKYTVIRHRKCVQIYNAVWDAKSPLSTSFNWKDYAVTLNQLGSTESLLTRPTAFFVLLLTVEILPRMNLDVSTFQQLHNLLVHLPYRALKSSFRMCGWTPTFMKQLEKLSQHFDLPVLFFPFMNNQFQFQSELVAPSQFCGERYMVSCAIAAGNFVTSIKSARSRTEDQSVCSGDSSGIHLPGNTETRSGRSCHKLVAGNRHFPCISDLWWAITQPQGNIYIRMTGWIMRKILRLTCTELTVDVASFAALSKCIESLKTELSQLKASQDHAGSIHVILAPTHRSFLDFIILSYICFAIPELGIAIPHIAAADDFSRVPILGWFAKGALAFFLKRGRGVADPELSNKLVKLKQSSRPESPVCIEVFIEGRRSRDRRFVCPKTGFLR